MTNKITPSREMIEAAAREMDRLGYGHHESHAASILYAAIADPVPPAGGAPAPEYFVAACDKFDWTPEEALRFYAEGKHFDVVDGRTRILCTGAIASHALKGIGGEYADMKGMAPAGGDVEVLGYSVKGNRYAIRLTKGELLELYEGYTGDALIELVDRAHVTRLQAEVKRLDLEVSAYDYSHDALSRERDALKAELRKTNLTNQDFVSQIRDLQSELTKARELFVRLLPLHGYSMGLIVEVNEWMQANQTAPADKGGDDWHMSPCKQGHCDVGAAGGVAHCYTCDEKIEAATTQEAFERWNATHPQQ